MMSELVRVVDLVLTTGHDMVPIVTDQLGGQQ
jgi:hypothetical protein